MMRSTPSRRAPHRTPPTSTPSCCQVLWPGGPGPEFLRGRRRQKLAQRQGRRLGQRRGKVREAPIIESPDGIPATGKSEAIAVLRKSSIGSFRPSIARARISMPDSALPAGAALATRAGSWFCKYVLVCTMRRSSICRCRTFSSMRDGGTPTSGWPSPPARAASPFARAASI